MYSRKQNFNFNKTLTKHINFFNGNPYIMEWNLTVFCLLVFFTGNCFFRNCLILLVFIWTILDCFLTLKSNRSKLLCQSILLYLIISYFSLMK